jgi:hypothetical protein
MLDFVTVSDNYALVCEHKFSHRMNQRWTQPRSEGGLGQHSSIALQTLWRIMGQNFVASIKEAIGGVQSPWRILQPPTGTGKTQGAHSGEGDHAVRRMATT